VPNADPESKIEKQQPVSTTTSLRKRNELGYDFGF
jgi:hypothetical protein